VRHGDPIMQVGGMSVKLIGEANDYVGKGMAGGDIVIVPPEEQTLDVRLPCSRSPTLSCS
jgi:GXGXG motif